MSMGTWNPQWDTRQPLDGAPRGLSRQVGVVVGRPFLHHGANATYVDIERETPIVNTEAWGNCYPVEEQRGRAEEMLNQTIADLDRLIWHLAGHRDRLKVELGTMPDREFIEDIPEPVAAEAPAGTPPVVVDVHLPESA